jgi:hypothetical protein
VRWLIARVLPVDPPARERPPTGRERYALELLLEPGIAARLRRSAGVVEGRLASLFGA